MYKKHEVVQLKQEFWTRFGQYMSPIHSASGERINWINYKTGVKDIYIRMEVDTSHAALAIELTHRDDTARMNAFRKLEVFKNSFDEYAEEEWNWLLDGTDEHDRAISKIGMALNDVNVLDKNSWSAIISFLKPRLIALDAFWNEVKEFMMDQ